MRHVPSLTSKPPGILRCLSSPPSSPSGSLAACSAALTRSSCNLVLALVKKRNCDPTDVILGSGSRSGAGGGGGDGAGFLNRFMMVETLRSRTYGGSCCDFSVSLSEVDNGEAGGCWLGICNSGSGVSSGCSAATADSYAMVTSKRSRNIMRKSRERRWSLEGRIAMPTKSRMTDRPGEAPSKICDQTIPRLKKRMRKNQNLRVLLGSLRGRANWYWEETRHM